MEISDTRLPNTARQSQKLTTSAKIPLAAAVARSNANDGAKSA